MTMNNKVLVGCSGGKDSSVVAALLSSQGYDVMGYTLKLLESSSEDDVGCCTFNDIRCAAKVCDKIGINYLVSSWKSLFKKNVIDPYIEGLKAGVNLNPCILCNSTIKIPALMAVAAHFGCDRVATGHYATVENGKIANSPNKLKNQSYMLCGVPQQFIERLMFPIGHITDKSETRTMARDFGLYEVADKIESQDICFFNGKTKEEFLRDNGIVSCEGNIVDEYGNVLGRHSGFMNYVVGQRARVSGMSEAKYVWKVIPETNTIVVGNKSQLMTKKVTIKNYQIDFDISGCLSDVEAVMRYHGNPIKVNSLTKVEDNVMVELNEEVFGVAPGQTLVFYHNDMVVGHGVIVC